MGKFSDRIRKMNAEKRKPTISIEFECNNCIKMFNFHYNDICMNKSGDIEFTPEPACPRCGSTNEILFSDFGQEKIENMLFKGEIKKN